MRIESDGKFIFEYQTPATLNQANPVQNTWYTILNTTSNARIYAITVNIEDTNETLDMQITCDGETINSDGLATNHSTNCYAYWVTDAIGRTRQIGLTNTATYQQYIPFLLEGKSIKVEVRKTTATGVGNLTGIVAYGVLKPC